MTSLSSPNTFPPENRQPDQNIEAPWHYETAIRQVEQIIHSIEGGELDLTEVVDQFTEAARILEVCEAFLQAKRAQVEITLETLGDKLEPEDPLF